MIARRSLPRLIPFALAAVAMAASAAGAQDTRPTVAVLYFDNNSIGKDAGDYAGIGKGIADLLITDLAASPDLRVVERGRIETLLREQDLVKQGTIDPETAIRLGKLLGVRHMVTGGFMSTGSQMVLTARTIDVESGRIANPQRVQQANDDVLGLVGQLSSRLTTTLKLPATERRTDDAGHEAHGASGHQHEAHMQDSAHKHDPAHHAAPQGSPAPRPAAAKPSKPAKLDLRTALLYSKALEAQDAGDRARAVQLYDQVLSRYPDLESARTNRAKLASSED
jgi:TolB-like protein